MNSAHTYTHRSSAKTSHNCRLLQYPHIPVNKQRAREEIGDRRSWGWKTKKIYIYKNQLSTAGYGVPVCRACISTFLSASWRDNAEQKGLRQCDYMTREEGSPLLRLIMRGARRKGGRGGRERADRSGGVVDLSTFFLRLSNHKTTMTHMATNTHTLHIASSSSSFSSSSSSSISSSSSPSRNLPSPSFSPTPHPRF